ncbi:hypothetical protein FJQ98_23865 [Lysinibacillus agricola]|uniref:Uncharacterized protein n=1 Tax=Lysinibacillus agricola TaxID=2590012 RepID=A0ABX7AR57_9BACI|nr:MULTISPECIES: hypothetical protein [Lysinibacillus]KOS63328.1 hypothetical protein AN161_08920 [Lysinibacillus sp. FJAT-14222]QQP12101.1 hypothetical protein FJQ98_23865 [Lysinibacillus agricola]
MAKRKGSGVVLVGLTLAASYLSKKENRDKALNMLNGAKSKLASYLNTTNTEMHEDISERITAQVATRAGTSPTKIASNEMVAEGGGHTGIHYFNGEIQEQEK